ncbi:hypothetical protein F6Y05_21485 [Bacillus megaterium]|nr:hypothetical protein [Priestia megaterium]
MGRRIDEALIDRKTLLPFLDFCVENGISKEGRIKMVLASMNNSGYDNLELFLNVSKKTLQRELFPKTANY